MADDARAVIGYLHENDVIAGFYMDPVGVDTTDEQNRALTDAVVDLAGVPADTFPGMSFPFTASVYNPWKAPASIVNGELRLTVDGPEDLTVDDLTVSKRLVDELGAPVTEQFILTEDEGVLTATIPMAAEAKPGYRLENDLLLSLAAEAPAGEYDITLGLWADPDGTAELSAVPYVNTGDTEPVEESAHLLVRDAMTTLMWGGEIAAVATQGSNITLPVRVFSPVPGTVELALAVGGPADATLVEGNVSLRRFDGTAMEATPLVESADGVPGLSTTVTETLAAGYNDLTWHLSVAEGAPVGAYTVDLGLAVPESGADLAGEVSIDITAPVDHKAPSAPVIEKPEVVGDSATITAASPADNDVVNYKFVLIKDFVHIKELSAATGTVTFTGLTPGTYKVNVTAFDRAGHVSDTAATTFVIEGSSTGGGTTPGTGTTPPPSTTPTDPPAEDPTTPPADDPGNQPEEAGPPETAIAKGPKDNAWLLRHRVTYRLRSNGEDATYRVRLDGTQLKDCTSPCTVTRLAAGTHRLSFAAAVGGQVDATPVVRTFTVPRGLEQLRFGEGWTVRDRERVFADFVETTERGAVLRTRARNIRRLALVASRGEGHGTVKVFLGERLLQRISLDSATAQRRAMVQVRTFEKPQRGLIRVVVVSTGKPVRLHGIGIATR